MNKGELDNIFKEAFAFLFSDHGCSIISSKKESWGYKLVAANSTTGIEIIYEFREAYIVVVVFRLIDGKIVNNIDRAVKSNEPMAGFGLEWIVNLKNPELKIKSAYDYEINIIDYASMVADRLKEYASDILNGDFSMFSTLDTMVKESYKDYYKKKNSQ